MAFMWTQLRFGQKPSTNPFVLSTGHGVAFFNDRGHRSHRGSNCCQLFALCSFFACSDVRYGSEVLGMRIMGVFQGAVGLSMVDSYAFPKRPEAETFMVVGGKYNRGSRMKKY